MKKKRLFLVIFLLFATFLSFLLLFKRGSGGRDINNIDNLSVNEAKVVARESLDYFESWKDPTLQESYTFYNLNGEVTAYLYNVRDNYGKAGYVVISVAGSVVEISKDTNTPITQGLRVVNKLTQGTIYEYEDIKTQYLYLNDDNYFIKLEIREGDNTQTLYYLLKKDSSKEVSLEELSS